MSASSSNREPVGEDEGSLHLRVVVPLVDDGFWAIHKSAEFSRSTGFLGVLSFGERDFFPAVFLPDKTSPRVIVCRRNHGDPHQCNAWHPERK